MILTERIYAIGAQGAQLRAGNVVLDIDERIHDETDAQRAIHVAEGLQEGDFAVFLRFEPKGTSTGYLVSHVDPETGEGIIVAGDAVERSPRIWMSYQLIENLDRLTDDEWEDFNLSSLRNYLLRQRLLGDRGQTAQA